MFVGCVFLLFVVDVNWLPQLCGYKTFCSTYWGTIFAEHVKYRNGLSVIHTYIIIIIIISSISIIIIIINLFIYL